LPVVVQEELVTEVPVELVQVVIDARLLEKTQVAARLQKRLLTYTEAAITQSQSELVVLHLLTAGLMVAILFLIR
jgi:hypothetical protein